MTYQRDTDPEVLADLRLRDASERDRTRSSPVHCAGCGHHVKAHNLATGVCGECECDQYERGGGPIWSAPVIAEHWPCRGGCGRMVEVTRDAVDQLAAFNAQLAKRRERAIGRHEVVWCDDCKRRDEDLQRAQRRPHEQRELGIDNQRRTR